MVEKSKKAKSSESETDSNSNGEQEKIILIPEDQIKQYQLALKVC
jgi:hypothetical protein